MLRVMETGNDAGGSKAGGRLALLLPTMPNLSPSSLWSRVAQNYICTPASGKGGGKRNALSFTLRVSVATAHGTSVQIPLVPIPVTTPQGRLEHGVLFWVAV